jgi:hypothetical protein
MTESGRFVARLPSLDVPVRFFFDGRTESSAVTPDTLILEPDVARLILLGRTSVPLPRKFTALHEIQVGQPKRTLPSGKPHYKDLSEAIKALQGRR